MYIFILTLRLTRFLSPRSVICTYTHLLLMINLAPVSTRRCCSLHARFPFDMIYIINQSTMPESLTTNERQRSRVNTRNTLLCRYEFAHDTTLTPIMCFAFNSINVAECNSKRLNSIRAAGREM